MYKTMTAAQVNELYGGNQIPCDPRGIAEKAGILVKPTKLDKHIYGQFKVLTVRGEEHHVILLNENNSEQRNRFVIANLLTSKFLNMGERKISSRQASIHTPKKSDADANRWALDLLCPITVIRKLHMNGVTSVADLASALGVSKKAITAQMQRYKYLEPYKR